MSSPKEYPRKIVYLSMWRLWIRFVAVILNNLPLFIPQMISIERTKAKCIAVRYPK
jgi:hypothetical protein